MRISERGFSAVEGVLVIAVLVVLGGIGFTVIHKKNTNVVGSNGTKGISAAQGATGNGVTSTIDSLTTQDEADESAIDKKYSASDDATVQTSASDAATLGGAYNESSL